MSHLHNDDDKGLLSKEQINSMVSTGDSHFEGAGCREHALPHGMSAWSGSSLFNSESQEPATGQGRHYYSCHPTPLAFM